jgi:hypothetical protein
MGQEAKAGKYGMRQIEDPSRLSITQEVVHGLTRERKEVSLWRGPGAAPGFDFEFHRGDNEE